MTSRLVLLAGLTCALAFAPGPGALAQEPTPEPTPPPPEAPAAPAVVTPTEDESVPWWGGKFALYLETAVGTGGTPFMAYLQKHLDETKQTIER